MFRTSVRGWLLAILVLASVPAYGQKAHENNPDTNGRKGGPATTAGRRAMTSRAEPRVPPRHQDIPFGARGEEQGSSS